MSSKQDYSGSTRCPVCSGSKGFEYRVALADEQGVARPLFVCGDCAKAFDDLINKPEVVANPRPITRKELTQLRTA